MRFDQPRSLRKSLSWLHGWGGLVTGWVLFAVFVTGSLSFFRSEISLWMQPELQVARDDGHGLERALALLREQASDAQRWGIELPNSRSPVMGLSWGSGGREKQDHRVMMDPATGTILQPRRTAGGNFLFDFHYRLHGLPNLLGEWVVGAAAMAMLVALVSGVIIHRNLVRDFFTFRPGKGKRSWLDAHNATGILALPFHLMIVFSGLLLLGPELMPAVATVAYGGDAHGMMMEIHRSRPLPVPRPTLREPAVMADLAEILAQGRQFWPEHGVRGISIANPGTLAAIVELRQDGGLRLAGRGQPERLRFDGVSGQLLPTDSPSLPTAITVWNSLQGLHIGVFAAPLARWMLFASGLLGAVMIATGLVIWVVGRQKSASGSRPSPGLRLVQVLNVAVMAGLLAALGGYFWANRLIPAEIPNRPSAEITVFFSVWAAALLHAAWRDHRRAWVEQLGLAGGLIMALPLLNAATGGAALPLSLVNGQGQVAGLDLGALLLGAMLVATALRVRSYRRVAPECEE